MCSGLKWVFPDDSVVKNPSTNTAEAGSIPESGRFPGSWQPTPGFLPRDPMNRGAWQTTVHGAAKESDTTQRLKNNNNILLQ